MPTENLWCQVGKHYYDREVTRGRKPVACPKHRGGDVDAMIRAPGHRPIKPAPVSMPAPSHVEHVSPSGIIPKVQTLICEHGNHTWTREPVRGKKPRYCPQHAPVPQPPAPKPVAAVREAQAAPAVKQPKPKVPKVVTPRVTVASILAEFRPDDETLRKLRYIEGEITRGREDVGGLLNTQAALIARLRRENRQRVSV